METAIISTKFHLPFWRNDGVLRARLLDVIQHGFENHKKMTLISAPAGYGKTSLAANWIHENFQKKHEHFHVAWLALDDFDNHPAYFLKYFLSAFRSVEIIDQENLLKLIDQIPSTSPEEIITGFLNEIADLDQKIVFVLDDFHVINNVLIHSTLEYLINYLPQSLHLILLTREDPPLALASMRARGQFTEIRAFDLRFTQEEADAFFSQTMKLELAQEYIETLEYRTEGWAAGLQLAGLALQNLEDPRKFIETFHGSHRYILDYLAEEVIKRQPDEIRDFLIHISIMDRFNAESCEAVTGRKDSQKILEKLEQTNMFVVPLDNERIWYRYHNLFADYLRTEMSKSLQISASKKAAIWFHSHNLITESVRYALLSEDDDFSADMIELAIQKGEAWSEGNLLTIRSWLDALPSTAFKKRPHLCLQASRFFYLSLRFQRAEELLELVDELIKENENSKIENDKLLAMSALFRGSIAAMRGEVGNAFKQITIATSTLPKEDMLAHARACFSLGQAYELNGKTAKAINAYFQSSKKALEAGVRYLAINALSTAGMLQIIQGNLHQASQTCQEALNLSANSRISPTGLCLCVLGSIAYEKFDLNAAEKYVMEGMALSRQGDLKDDIGFGLILLERIKSAQGLHAEALTAVQKASDILHTYEIPRFLTIEKACRARCHFDSGNRSEALSWARNYYENRKKGEFEYLHEFEDLVMIRILLSDETPKELPAILDSLREKAASGGRNQIHIEALLLTALYERSVGKSQDSLKHLEKALQIAEPHGQIRSFLVEGKDLLDLIPRLRNTCSNLVDEILAKSGKKVAEDNKPVDLLPDPLSDQEKNVLQLILSGKSNLEIAETLFISVGTAKWHVHNILRKIGADNRAQAIIRAKELGF